MSVITRERKTFSPPDGVSLRRRWSAFALPALLPLLMFGYTLSVQDRENTAHHDLNLSGSLRTRSLWVYAAAQRRREADWRPALAQMQAVRETLLRHYPRETHETDGRWNAFAGSLRKTGRVDWQTAEAMRLAANQLTEDIEQNANAQNRNVLWLFVSGLFAQGLALVWQARNVRRQAQTDTEREQAFQSVREQEQRLNHLVENLPAGAVYIEGGLVSMNRGAELITGYDRTQMRTIEGWFTTIFRARAAEIHALYEEVKAAGFPAVEIVPMVHRDGTLRQVEFAGYLSAQSEVWLLHDVTQQQRTFNALLASRARQEAIVQTAADGILTLDAKGAILSFNGAAARIWGYETQEVVGQNISLLIAECSFFALEGFVAPSLSRGETEQKAAMREGQGRRKDGAVFPLEFSFGFAAQQDGPVYVCVLRDVTERREHERQREESKRRLEQQIARVNEQAAELEAANAQLAALATTDGLTGIKNHRAFQERLNADFERCARYNHPLSLLLIDVDKFKQFNDTFGHPAGDEVLKRVAQTIQAASRAADFVARYGGEEFVVVLPDTDAPGAIEAGERICRAVAEQSWEQRGITVSIGAVTLTPATQNPAEMVESADKSLYLSKERGRNRVTFAESPSLVS